MVKTVIRLGLCVSTLPCNGTYFIHVSQLNIVRDTCLRDIMWEWLIVLAHVYLFSEIYFMKTKFVLTDVIRMFIQYTKCYNLMTVIVDQQIT